MDFQLADGVRFQRFNGFDGYEFALPDNTDTVADFFHFRQDMRGKKNGAAFFFRFGQ